MSSGIRRNRSSVNVWPGYVDALSALLMLVIFVILIFTLAHFLLSEIVTGQESELVRLQKSLQELTEALGLEEARSKNLENQLTEISAVIDVLSADKTRLETQVTSLSEAAKQDSERIREQLLLVVSLQEDIAALRKMRRELEDRIGRLVGALEDKEVEVGAVRDRSMALESQLADERERTMLAQRNVASQNIRIQALMALVGEQDSALEKEKELSAGARAQVAVLSRQVEAMKRQLEEISRALAAAELVKQAQVTEIENLGRRLNIELARRVNELEFYRSDFFGRLREVLGNNPFVRITGDRFVFQSELLFASGSADLGEEGQKHLKALSLTMLALLKKIPEEIDWILRVDGHTDRLPAHRTRFGSNWELSTARAVSVVRFLVSQGIEEERMAAAGFGEFHPLDPADTDEAYRKNRRIEIKLTSR
jgi:chemotaxis protein MotB